MKTSWIQLLSVKFMSIVFVIGLDDCNPNPCGPGESCIDKIGGVRLSEVRLKYQHAHQQLPSIKQPL